MKKTIFEFSSFDWFGIFWPVLLYPAAYFPYRLWGVVPFAKLVGMLFYGVHDNPMWLIYHTEETIMIFWFAVSVAAMLAAVAMSLLKVRPRRYILLYLMIKASLYAFLSLTFYKLMS